MAKLAVLLAFAAVTTAAPAANCHFVYSEAIKRDVVYPIARQHPEYDYDVEGAVVLDKENPVQLRIYAANVLDADPLVIRIDACTGKLVDVTGGAQSTTTIVPCPKDAKVPPGTWCGDSHKN